MVNSSPVIKKYFESMDVQIQACYKLAAEARKKGFDPEEEVPIPLAKNMAERVVGLISVLAPQIAKSNVTQRITELESEYGMLDWRVGFKIAEEVAKQEHCKFENKQEAMEMGIRVGFAYLTLGIVSAPLEGFIGLKIKKRRDGKEYLAIQYAGPIRGAGGTAASTSVILADYVRVKMGYSPYDPDEAEVNRYTAEIHDYHERVTNLQYHPSDAELKFVVSHLPVEVDGDPTEKFEVSNYKDIPRIETNLIRGGVALVLAEGVSQKAPKLWKKLSKWGKDFDLDWEWLEEFLKLKEEIHASHTVKSDGKQDEKKVKENNTFITDLVAGRPILTHPLASGGFRLRYGRGRTTGFSASATHPATLIVLDKFIAIGTQLKTERPGKATTITICDTVEGPIVRLKDGSVRQLLTEEEAIHCKSEVEEIIFLGDILFNYGDFSENGHALVPAGYCPEWWALEVLAKETSESPFLKEPLFHSPTFEEAVQISLKLDVALHPSFTFYWKLISGEETLLLSKWLGTGKLKSEKEIIKKIILPLNADLHKQAKRVLEKVGIPHEVISKENVVIHSENAKSLALCFDFSNQEEMTSIKLSDMTENGLKIINSKCKVTQKDKAGTFIGARMGRPEKAKMRHMTGSPQAMFPVGEEGDRLRSFQSALKAGKIRSSFPMFFCEPCSKPMIYRRCEECGGKCIEKYHCRFCGDLEKDTCRHGKAQFHKIMDLNINYFFKKAQDLLKEKVVPDLIKGVRGTTNKDHLVEHLAKGILRSKHNIYVNKDGTTRYDCTELPLTHFKPKEIKTSIDKLKELGYKKDISGNELIDSNQILEIKPQDIILPGYDSLDESAPRVLLRVAKFVDDLLVKLYGLKPYYNAQKEQDLVGHLVIGLAPHISAGLVGRIIGFSETQGLITSPMYHAGMRRDCFDRDTYIPFSIKGKWQIQKLGDLIESYNPTKVVDDFGTKEIKVESIKTIGRDGSLVSVNNFTKHPPKPMVKIQTKLGRSLKVTKDHKQIIFRDNREEVIRAHQLKLGDNIGLPYKLEIPKKDIKEIDLFNLLADQEWVMVRGVNSIKDIKEQARKYFSKRDFDNYTRRDSYPIKFISRLKRKGVIPETKKLFLAAKRDKVMIPTKITVNKEFLQLVGLYIAEGYSRMIPGNLYQSYIATENEEVRSFIRENMKNIFGLKVTEKKKDRSTYSSRIIYYLFTSILKCGSSAYEKRIPSLFLSLPNQKLGYLLSGYFEGDGSVSSKSLRATFDTVSEGLLRDLDFVFGQMNIFVKNYTYTSFPGPKVKDFYVRKGKVVPKFTLTKGTIQSAFMKKFSKYINFISSRKKNVLLDIISSIKPTKISIKYNEKLVFDEITSIEFLPEEESYCLNVKDNIIVANSIITKQCDGDEACVMLLMDALLNFSRQYLPERRGAKTMDAPLVLTSLLDPAEVDDQVHGMDVEWQYPLELYEAALEMKKPWEVSYGKDKKKINQISDRLGTPDQYEGFGFTHHVDNFNRGIQCSAYKTLPSMEEKLFGQMEIAKRVRAVDLDDVAKLVIQKHFLKDIKGNLRKFSMQQFRCVKCNSKYRRPPLTGKCSNCEGKLIFTISEGSVVKYLGHSLRLAENYDFSPYLKQTLDVLKIHVESIFGKEKDKQVGLGEFLA